MKELSIEEKAKAYDIALDKIKRLLGTGSNCSREELEYIFPELRESDDERIRKEIIAHIKWCEDSGYCAKEEMTRWITFLEKQGEQKPTDIVEPKDYNNIDPHFGKPIDKIEPKFKVGDFLVSDYCMGKVVELTNDAYLLDTEQGIPFSCEHNAHIWTIQDAKDGDVVVDKSDGTVGIFQSIGHHPDGGSCNDPSYCFLHCRYDDGFFYADFEHGNTMDSDDVIPATKEQRDQLEKAMADAGYTFDFEKKELKKIVEKPAWSEEDERNLQGIIDEIEANKNHAPGYDIATYDRFLSWLKSLKERYSWKPSDEQMKALWNVYQGGEEQAELATLYNDLTKLRKE